MAVRTPAKLDDDLFKDSTMSFGEHLEELRGSLFKAIGALMIGFTLGLCIGNYVVMLIQSPLETALFKYYAKQAIAAYQQDLAARKQAGLPVPAELEDENNIRKLIFQERLLFDGALYVAPESIVEQLRAKYPQEFGQLKLPAEATSTMPSRDNMLRIFTWRPAEQDRRLRIITLNPQEAFMIYIKASFIAGAILSSPAVFYFLWSFVAAGLYPHEKKYVHVFMPFSAGLFLFGAVLAFLFVFPPVLNFFLSFNEWLGSDAEPRLSEWLSFVLLLPLGFGVAFQLPLVMLFLERIGVFTVESYLSKWRVAVLVMAFAAMVLSPGGDPYSMLLMLAPLILLYFSGIGLCKWMSRARTV